MTRIARTGRARLWPLAAIVAAFVAGAGVDAWLRTYGPPIPASVRGGTDKNERDDGTRGAGRPDRVPTVPAVRRAVAPTTGTIPHDSLRVPIDGANVEAWKGGFDERRDGGGRGHEAVDILSPRNTPVHAVTDGTIAKIFESKAGGHTIYQFDRDGRLCYYYAHLERYADGLRDGQTVEQGDVIGYVGTSGNAPANTPHLHFAVYQLDSEKRWWKGTPLDPYLVFTRGSGDD
jgi:murein DD-endopeptidase MepM/ murein hydrolase activator NlpD